MRTGSSGAKPGRLRDGSHPDQATFRLWGRPRKGQRPETRRRGGHPPPPTSLPTIERPNNFVRDAAHQRLWYSPIMPTLRDRSEALKPSPSLKLSALCPSCGRKDVVVFPTFYSADGQASTRARQVCSACCPRLENLSKSAGDDTDDFDFVAHVEQVRARMTPPAADGKPASKRKK